MNTDYIEWDGSNHDWEYSVVEPRNPGFPSASAMGLFNDTPHVEDEWVSITHDCGNPKPKETYISPFTGKVM